MISVAIYGLATLLAVAAAFACERCGRRWLLVVAAVPLLLVAAARWNTGTDFRVTYHPLYCAVEQAHGAGGPVEEVQAFRYHVRRNYLKKCDTVQKVGRHFAKVLERTEPAYRALMEGAYRAGLGYRGVQAFCALVTLALVFLAIYRQSRWPTLAVFLFVATSNYFLSLNIMRQYLAIAIGLVSLEFAVDRKPGRFLACVCTAVLFHYSAWLLLPAYALQRCALTPRRAVVLVLVALALSCVLAPVLAWALEAVGASHYARYFTSRHAEEGFEWILFAVNVVFLAAGAWYWRQAAAENRFFALWYSLTALGTAALACSAAVPLMKRINYYYAAPQFLMLPEILLAERNPKRRRILTALAVLAFVAETVVAVGVFNKNGCLPYRWR